MWVTYWHWAWVRELTTHSTEDRACIFCYSCYFAWHKFCGHKLILKYKDSKIQYFKTHLLRKRLNVSPFIRSSSGLLWNKSSICCVRCWDPNNVGTKLTTCFKESLMMTLKRSEHVSSYLINDVFWRIKCYCLSILYSVAHRDDINQIN